MASAVDAISLRDSLRDKGIFVCLSWVEQALMHLRDNNRQRSIESIYQLFLRSDYHEIYDKSASFVSREISSTIRGSISKPFVLQIDEIVNVGASTDQKLTTYCSRLLKVYMTNGHQNVSHVALGFVLYLIVLL